MIIDSTKPIRRLGIYFFFDKDGIIDNYIPVLLRDLVKNLEVLVFVSNGPIAEEGKKKLEEFNPFIIERENRGMDVWAYKEAMQHFGWKKLAEFDEVVLLNFTIMGPVLHSFSEAFKAMESQNLHFWGMTKHHGVDHDPWNTCKYGYIPAHIQSSFMVFRSDFIKSKAFQHYWETLPMITRYEESIGWHEAIFTEDFTRLGFISNVYVNTEDIKDFSDYPLMLYPKELVTNRNCPIFKRKLFYNIYTEFFAVSYGQSAAEFYDYIRENDLYDVDLIWQTLLRTANLADIKDRMQLNYILPRDCRLDSTDSKLKVALFVHMYYVDDLDSYIAYLENFPKNADIFFTTDTSSKMETLRAATVCLGEHRVKILKVQNQGRDVSALLIGLKNVVNDYDLVCFMHDKKTQYFKPYMIGESFAQHLMENILGSEMLVQNIIKTFEDNPRLGILTPPVPIHSNFSTLPGTEWQINFSATQQLARKIGINVPMSEDRAPIAPLGTMFWFRPKSLRIIFDYGFSYDDFPVEPNHPSDGTIMHQIERLYPFASQQAGYYSAWVMSDYFSKFMITNYNRIASDYNRAIYNKIGLGTRDYYVWLLEHSSFGSMNVLSPTGLKISAKQIIKKLFGQKGLNTSSRLWRKIKKV